MPQRNQSWAARSPLSYFLFAHGNDQSVVCYEKTVLQVVKELQELNES